MSNAVPFDTLAFAKKLEARGVDNKQAEAHAEALAEVLETSFLTKQESNSIVSELSLKIETSKSEIIKWVFGVSFAQAALILSVLKFFH